MRSFWHTNWAYWNHSTFLQTCPVMGQAIQLYTVTKHVGEHWTRAPNQRSIHLFPPLNDTDLHFFMFYLKLPLAQLRRWSSAINCSMWVRKGPQQILLPWLQMHWNGLFPHLNPPSSPFLHSWSSFFPSRWRSWLLQWLHMSNSNSLVVSYSQLHNTMTQGIPWKLTASTDFLKD